MIIDLLILSIQKIKYEFKIITEQDFNNNIIDFIRSQGVIFVKFIQLALDKESKKRKEKKIGNDLYSKLLELYDKCNQYNYINYPEFNYIYYKPIASGSLCQIYKINYNQKNSVLKTPAPFIRNSIKKGLSNITFLKDLLFYFNKYYYKLLNLIDIDEFHKDILTHLDLQKESENMRLFYNIFKNIDRIIIPEVYNIENQNLIMSFENGIKLFDIKDDDTYLEAILLLCSFTYVSIKNNVLHGDFHHGNFLFRKDDNNLKLIVLDFGIINKISNKESELLLNLFELEYDDSDRNHFISELFKIHNIQCKTDKIRKSNIFEKVEIEKIPKIFITLFTIIKYFNKLNYDYTSLSIKLFNFMYKNKFIEV